MSNESMTRWIAGSESSMSACGEREKCALISGLGDISAAAAATSGRATARRFSLSNCSIPHSCAAAISSITAGPETFSAGRAMRSAAVKSRIVRIAGLRVTST